MRGGVDPTAAIAAFSGDDAKEKPKRFEMNPFLRIREIDPAGELVMTQAELEVFIETFERTGFTGGVNWYWNPYARLMFNVDQRRKRAVIRTRQDAGQNTGAAHAGHRRRRVETAGEVVDLMDRVAAEEESRAVGRQGATAGKATDREVVVRQ